MDMDAVEEFFGALPDLDRDHRTIVQYGAADFDHCSTAIDKFLKSDSGDPDHLFLLSAAKLFSTGFRGELSFRQHLGKLALSKALSFSISSQKDRQLQYYRWIAQGRKDEDSPLRLDAQRAQLQTTVTTHAHLTDTSPKACANCGKGPDGLIWCSACPVKVHDCMVTCTLYCGKQCQEQHWPSHKKVCGARKKLWRAVQLIQELHIKFQANTFVPVVEELIVKNGILYCIDRSKIECVVTGMPTISMLTRDQAPSEETFLAAIMASKCSDISSVCKPLLDTLLKPLGLRIEEICVVPRNIHRSTCTIAGNNRGMEEHIAFCTHNLLRITLPNGEQMALDFSGHQLGWHEILSPWTVWKNNRALSVGPPNAYGTMRDQEGILAAMMVPESDEGEKRRNKVIAIINSTVRDLMAHENIAKATKLFSLDNSQYNSVAKALLSLVDKKMAEDSEQYAKSRVGLQYYNEAWKVCWTLDEAQAAALDDVWLTEAEVQSCGGNESRLKQIWASRCRGPQKQNQFKALGMCMQFN